MVDLSLYESRTGTLTCSPSEVYDFVTDIRNFSQFVPGGAVSNLQINSGSCSFSFSPLGNINVNLAEKEPHSRVVFNGNVLQSNDFSLVLHIKENEGGKAEVKVRLEAYLNPLLKMMASKPIGDFLAKLVDEMESFRGWKETKEDK